MIKKPDYGEWRSRAFPFLPSLPPSHFFFHTEHDTPCKGDSACSSFLIGTATVRLPGRRHTPAASAKTAHGSRQILVLAKRGSARTASSSPTLICHSSCLYLVGDRFPEATRNALAIIHHFKPSSYAASLDTTEKRKIDIMMTTRLKK